MVRRESLCDNELDRSSCYTSDGSDDQETASITSTTSRDENCHHGLAIIPDGIDKDAPSFGNISVTHSNDVHFGNKTFYQGPVTIKQFVYANNSKLPISESAVSDNGSVYKIDLTTDTKHVPNSLPEVDHNGVLNNGDIKHVTANENKINNNVEVERKKDVGCLQYLPRHHVIMIISICTVLVISLVTSTAVLLARSSIVEPDGIITFPNDGLEQEETDVGLSRDNGSFTLPGKLKIVARAEWVAQPATDQITPLKLPVPYVIIMHTATEACTDVPTCIFHVRHIQMYHIESNKWWDIGYNFLVGGDGFAYEGRGWKSEGAHTYGYNARSIGIAFIGTFTSVLPLQRQITAAQQLIEKGVELGYVAKDYKLLAARQLQSTESPGKLFFEHVKTWAHWAETP